MIKAPSVNYERLCTDADLSLSSLEYALHSLGNPVGVCVVHVSPQWVATDRAWLDGLVEMWAKEPGTSPNPLQIVGDHDIKWINEWFLEIGGRRIGSPAL